MKNIYLLLALFFNCFLFSQNFHDTQGALEVSGSGQATFTVPIAMPASIGDVGPVINLVYASGQQGGIVGQGWNISSISSIARMSTRADIEGYRDGVDFDADDKLSLDGQRLLLKSGTYWANNSTYETEVQSNTKIELKGFGASMYFIVTNADGSRAWYGNYGGMNATDLTAFYITRFEDTNGNFMTYHYSKPLAKSLCLTEIRFSANVTTNPTPLNKIVFSYKTLARKEYGYVKGIKTEKFELLQKVEVFTNSLLFKRYEITHAAADTQGYERVSKIQEYNGSGEAANPIEFTYNPQTADGATEITKTYDELLDLSEQPDLGGDFDGDGRLDFISNGKVYTNLFVPGTNVSFDAPSLQHEKLVGSTLKNGKLNQGQSLITIEETLTQNKFRAYHLDTETGFEQHLTKTIDFNNQVTCYDECAPANPDDICYELVETAPDVFTPVQVPCSNRCATPILKDSNEYLEGDFNGDGISEILVLSHAQWRTYAPSNSGLGLRTVDPLPVDCVQTNETSDVFNGARIVDLNPNTTSEFNTAGNYNFPSYGHLQGEKRFVMDFNSDGKDDILVIDKKAYKVITLKHLTIAPWATVEIIGQGTIENYTKDKTILFGDYNGDGKPDMMMPDSDNKNGCAGCRMWHVYYSNPNPAGGSFFVKETFDNIIEYRPNSDADYERRIILKSYYALDVNKDGKADIVSVDMEMYWGDIDQQDKDTKWKVVAYVNNIGFNGTFTNYYESPFNYHASDDNSWPIPIAAPYKYGRFNNDLVVVRYHGNNAFPKKSTFINFTKNFNDDNLLTSVSQSSGAIINNIDYLPMTTDLLNGLQFYTSNESLHYPYVEINRMPGNKLVSELRNTSLGVTKLQNFRYHGYAVNLNGIGALGFLKTARSNWFVDKYSEKVQWSVSENNPMQRGATIKSYLRKLNPSEEFQYCSAFTLTYCPNLISYTESSFIDSTEPISKRYSLLLDTQTTTDFLTNVRVEKKYNSYSTDYLLPLSVTTKNYLGTELHGSTTTVTDYDNVVTGTGSGYYIGRPKEVTTTSTVYVNTATGSPDTKTSNTKYFYTNGNLTQTEKKANGSAETLIETFAYFSNGLLQSKTISATGAIATEAVSPRTTSYTYDPTNRFVKTTTDVEGLVSTNLTYHPIYGTVLTQKNPYNQTTTVVIDNWGKQTKVTDFLGKSINYTYTKASNLYTTTQTGDDGSVSMVQSDVLSREVKKGSKNMNGNWVYVDNIYNYKGYKVAVSEPYFSSSSPTQWTSYEYDDYGRPIKVTAHTGKIVTTTYNGLTATVTEPAMSKSKTSNANGQVITAVDSPGGTIAFKYDAMGNLTESDYDGIKLKMQYDNWGRKIQLEDSSAGIYTYQYNAFGETIKEVTPKGTTTYTLSPLGKLMTKSVVGLTAAEKTNITSTYTYDPTNKWLTNMAVVNTFDGNSNYAYTYDTTTKQLKTTVETLYPLGSTTALATFTKSLTFDAFGRVANETSTAVAHGKTSSKTITHVYNAYGAETQLKDGTVVKYQENTTNARGQLTSATLGNGITIANSYDIYGYATQNKHDKATTNIMTLNYAFEPILANLQSRSNSMFSWNESFQYDALDRLTHYTNGAGTQTTQNYDDRGRITANNLGSYQYTNGAKPYQNTSVLTSTEAQTYYDARPLQQISYTAFKTPIEIFEQGVDRITFGYNAALQRNIMYYGNTNTDKLTRPYRKYYSADGSMEIKATFGPGSTTTPTAVEIITYLGGDAYSAPMVVKSNGTTQSYFYLHRDYQGSILAITNDTGAVVEKRLFDAWGLLLKVQNGAGVNLAGLTFFDRGYTGHEHLQSVGLINMNARLYDPKLHRFLSPDNYIQEPYNTQNYNRYAYCVNNPLKYTDVTGNVFEWAVLGAAVLIGALVGTAAYLVQCVIIGNISAGGVIQSAIIGAISGAVTFGIGEHASTIGNFYYRASYSALAHGMFQGTLTGVQGGNFWQGFAAGAISSIASSVWQGGDSFRKSGNINCPDFANDFKGIGSMIGFNGKGSMIAFGTIMGGAGAAMSKGNFWEGAVTGLVVSGLNHAFDHANEEPKLKGGKFNNKKFSSISEFSDIGYFKSSVRYTDIFSHAEAFDYFNQLSEYTNNFDNAIDTGDRFGIESSFNLKAIKDFLTGGLPVSGLGTGLYEYAKYKIAQVSSSNDRIWKNYQNLHKNDVNGQKGIYRIYDKSGNSLLCTQTVNVYYYDISTGTYLGNITN